MDGMLSQDEINALLNGMDLGNSSSNDSQSGSLNTAAEAGNATLSDVEKDAIGEVANISMGTSATTLYSLVNRKVNITTPVVTMETWDNLIRQYEKPCVFIQIRYTTGLAGTNILVMKEHDVKVITDLMMGGDGTNTAGELGELYLSAISEAMNQMMGSSATSLSSMLGKKIDISPPEASLIDLNDFKAGADIADFLKGDFVKISFRMQIEDLVDSSIMQLYPIDFAKSLYTTFMNQQMPQEKPKPAAPAYTAPSQMDMQMGMGQMQMPQMQMPQMQMPQMGMGQMQMPQMQMPQMQMSQMGMPQMQMPQMQMPQMGMGQMQMPQMQMPQMGMGQMQNMNIQPAQFQNFSTNQVMMQSQENIGLIRDVPLEVTVELGRTSKLISDILEFAPGTIIELDKIAGEPIDVLVNGKFVAKGEVVVIEESFGVRVTEIIK